MFPVMFVLQWWDPKWPLHLVDIWWPSLNTVWNLFTSGPASHSYWHLVAVEALHQLQSGDAHPTAMLYCRSWNILTKIKWWNYGQTAFRVNWWLFYNKGGGGPNNWISVQFLIYAAYWTVKYWDIDQKSFQWTWWLSTIWLVKLWFTISVDN